MRLISMGVALALWAGAGNAALACQGTEVLFEDKFDTLEPTWGDPDDAFFLENGSLTITPGLDEFYSALNTAGVYDDIDYCLSVTPKKADPDGDSFAGPIFWASDYDNYYSVLITAEGSIGVFRRQRGKTLPQVNWADFAALKEGNGAVNEVRVVTQGNQATIFVNGQKYRTIKGQPPSVGQQIGVRATSPKNDRAIFTFDNIKATLPPTAPAN